MKRSTLFVCIAAAAGCLGFGTHARGDTAEGARLATALCAQCHAVGTRGRSPHPSAPPFRNFAARFDLERTQGLLEEGTLVATHRDMPSFKLDRKAAKSIFDYIHSIQE